MSPIHRYMLIDEGSGIAEVEKRVGRASPRAAVMLWLLVGAAVGSAFTIILVCILVCHHLSQ